MRRFPIPALALSALLLGSACQGPPITDANRTDVAAGAGLGALTGGLLGSLSGNFGWGALIGGAAGAAGGYLYDRGRSG